MELRDGVGLWLREGVADGLVLRDGVGAARLGPGDDGVALGVWVGPQLGMALGWLGAGARLPDDGAAREGVLPHDGTGSEETVPREGGGVRPAGVRSRVTDSRCAPGERVGCGSRCVAGERREACGSITVTWVPEGVV